MKFTSNITTSAKAVKLEPETLLKAIEQIKTHMPKDNITSFMASKKTIEKFFESNVIHLIEDKALPKVPHPLFCGIPIKTNSFLTDDILIIKYKSGKIIVKSLSTGNEAELPSFEEQFERFSHEL